ncbi:18984_t:CDS:1, partial [Racocetra persica]
QDDIKRSVLPTQETSLQGKKFLTFLPHSGFSNQFISLRNAIMLAYITNRTLIMPPIIVKKKISFHEFDRLYEDLNS